MIASGGSLHPSYRGYRILPEINAALAGHLPHEVLAFKGGTALRHCWFEDYRFPEDLDFILTRPIAFGATLAELGQSVPCAQGMR